MESIVVLEVPYFPECKFAIEIIGIRLILRMREKAGVTVNVCTRV